MLDSASGVGGGASSTATTTNTCQYMIISDKMLEVGELSVARIIFGKHL